MKSKASIKDAVNLIQRAVKDGWSREVSYMRYRHNGETWSAMVSLTRDVFFQNGAINLHSLIMVSFRKTNRCWVVSIAVPRPGCGKTFRGLWHANYALREMSQTVQRQSERKGYSLNTAEREAFVSALTIL